MPPQKRRRGGIRQRLEAAETQQATAGGARHQATAGGNHVANFVANSLLAAFLVEQFAWGHFSPQLIQKIAALACADFDRAREQEESSLDDLRNLAQLGSRGAFPNNVHRDLMARMSAQVHLPEPFAINMPFKAPLGDRLQSVLLPHEMFASLYHDYPEAWKTYIVPDIATLSMFWAAARHHPQLASHPLLQRNQYEKLAVPLGIHGDGVPVIGIGKGWTRMMTMFSWSSLLAKGPTKEICYYIWSVFDRLCCKADGSGTMSTMDTFFTVLRWSLYWLWRGQWPDRDWTGQMYDPDSSAGSKALSFLADGHFGLLWAIMGDLDYLASILGLPRFSASTGPCALCRCTGIGPNTWTDSRPTAPWIEECWTSRDWLLWEGRSRNPLFTLPGVTALTVALDYMHSKYLGMDQYMFGSTLWVLCFMVMTGTPEENLDWCWAFTKRYYKEHGTTTRYRYLNRLSMFVRKKGYPKLRGKAAEIRHFGPVLLALWAACADPASELHQRIQLMLKLNVRLESILTEHPDEFALPGTAASEFQEAAFAMAQLQTATATHFMEQGQQLYDITSKTHMVLHCAILSKYISPRVSWCFSGEDNMRVTQTLAQSCVRGLTGSAAQVKMARHYRLGLHLSLAKRG